MKFSAQQGLIWLPPRHIERRATFDGSAPFAVVRRLSISRPRRSSATSGPNQALGAGSFTESACNRPLQRVWQTVAGAAAATRAGIAKPRFVAALTKAARVLMRIALYGILTTGWIVFAFGAVLVYSRVLVL
jgi:hypothetical protein